MNVLIIRKYDDSKSWRICGLNNYELLTEAQWSSRGRSFLYLRLQHPTEWKFKKKSKKKKKQTVINYSPAGQNVNESVTKMLYRGYILAYSLPRLMKSVKAVLLKSFFLIILRYNDFEKTSFVARTTILLSPGFFLHPEKPRVCDSRYLRV